MKTALLAAACAIAVAGCASSPSSTSRAPAATPQAPAVSTAKSARVVLAPASGSLVSGTLNLVPTADGVRIAGEIGGLTAGGTHAIHIHETGDCSAADASSAGGHFNPGNDPHGRAVVVHAKADDYTSQPSGNAGDRVACGVIEITG